MSIDSNTRPTTGFGSKIKSILSSLFSKGTDGEKTETPAQPVQNGTATQSELDTIFVPSEMYADFVRRAVASDRNHPDRHYTAQK